MSPRRRFALPSIVAGGDLVLTLAVLALIALPPRAEAQSALHSADASPIPTPVATRCASAPAHEPTAEQADSLGMDDDSIPASALPPESGMVLIDRNGHEVHVEPLRVARGAGNAGESADRPRCVSAGAPRLVATSAR